MIPASFSTALPVSGTIRFPAGSPLTPVFEIADAYKRTFGVSSHVGLTRKRQLSCLPPVDASVAKDCMNMKSMLFSGSLSSQKLPFDKSQRNSIFPFMVSNRRLAPPKVWPVEASTS